MAKVGRITDQTGAEVLYAFDCPGCGIGHSFRVQGEGPKWEFNGDIDNPTFAPSLLVHWPKMDSSGRAYEVRCHSFVRNGRIEFLTDCDHALAGQTVSLPDPTSWSD